jgi:hypothetical protein
MRSLAPNACAGITDGIEITAAAAALFLIKFLRD